MTPFTSAESPAREFAGRREGPASDTLHNSFVRSLGGARRAPERPLINVKRKFALGLGAVWAVAAAMLYYLQPGLGATYLVASGWLAVGGAAVWALTRWPPFRHTIERRRGNRKTPDGPGAAR